MTISFDELNNILKKRLFRKILNEKNINYDVLLIFAPHARDFNEAIFMLKNNIAEIPICSYLKCREFVPFRFYSNSNQFYPSGCCEDHCKKINNLKKYGVENVSQLKNVKEKKKITTFKNYGVENPKQNKQIANKIKNTMQQKYGGFGKSGILKEKIENTCLERYGNSNPMKIKQHRDALVKNLFTKIVERLSDFVTPNFSLENYLGSASKQEWKCVKCDKIFEGKIDNGSIPRCPICFPNQQRSYGEMDLFNCIGEVNKTYSDWNILKNRELDIFIPNKKLAIEFNGIYWHSELHGGKDKNYHLDKTNKCKEKDIQLIHIFETEWNFQKEIVISLINAKLGIFDKRIYARKCSVKEITQKEKNKFLKENHLQGIDKSSVKLALFYDEKIVAVMTFGKSQYNTYQYEMYRFCSKIGCQIIGGASKLWKYFIDTYEPKSVITYADRRYSNGSFYEKIGFSNIGTTEPNYFVINKSKLESSLHWQKHKLKDKLEKFDSSLTAWENLRLNKYDRVWDCGNYKFGWING